MNTRVQAGSNKVAGANFGFLYHWSCLWGFGDGGGSVGFFAANGCGLEGMLVTTFLGDALLLGANTLEVVPR